MKINFTKGSTEMDALILLPFAVGFILAALGVDFTDEKIRNEK